MTVMEARLYATNGTTKVGVLSPRRDLRVMEELNGVGAGQVTVPAAAAAAITNDQVVKVALDGTIVSGFIVEKRSRVHVDSDGLPWVTLSGRGLMAWLEDAVVYPQLGFSPYSPTDRPFNFAGVGGHWEDRITYTTPVGLIWKSVTDSRRGSPKGWPDRNAYWIWATNPASTVAAGARNWFTSSLSAATTRKLRFHVTADNYFSLYLDGTLILSSSDIGTDGNLWRSMATRTLTVPAGSHRISVEATNGSNGSSSNRAGLLVCVTEVTSAGKPGAVVRRTDTTHWTVTDDEPSWYPSEIMETLIIEGRIRGCARLNNFAVGWGEYVDSSSRSWSTVTSASIRCGTHYLDVLERMIDYGVDFTMSAGDTTNTMLAYETRGTDKSASVLLAVAKNLTDYGTSAQSTGKTASLVRSNDGWTQAANAAGVTVRGRRETFLEFGNTNSEVTAAAAAARILARTAATTVTVERVSAIPTADAMPLVTFAPGDRVSAPSSTGGATTARVLSVTLVEGDDGLVTYEPELEVLV